MPRLFSNNASTTLLNPLNTSDTVFIVENLNDAVAQFPDLTDPADFAIITVENADATFEIMRLTDIDSGTNQFTVVRGDNFAVDDIDKTTSIAFLAGARVELRTTAGAFSSYLQRDGEIIHGGVFGASPTAPADVQTLVTKHSTGTAAPVLGDVEIGELAFNAKTRKLYAGGVDSLNAKELVEILATIHVGTSAPTYPSVGQLWWATALNSLYIYGPDLVWRTVIGAGTIYNPLQLTNNTALQSRNAGDTAWADLIKLNGTDELVLGTSGPDVATFRALCDLLDLGQEIRLTAQSGFGTWALLAGSVLGHALITLGATTGSGIGSGLAFNVKSAANVVRSFVLDMNGYLTLPQTTPTQAGHAASKAYVDSVAGAVSGITHAVNVTSAGAAVGTAVGVASTVRDSLGTYTITLATPLTAVNNAILHATPRSNSATAINSDCCTAMATSTTTVVVRIRRNGSNPVFIDSDFSLSILDTGV